MSRLARTFKDERRFALLMVVPGVTVLIVTSTLPLLYLVWSSFQNINLLMPHLDGFAGLDNYVRMAGDTRFWEAMQRTVIYTTSTVFLQIVRGAGYRLRKHFRGREYRRRWRLAPLRSCRRSE